MFKQFYLFIYFSIFTSRSKLETKIKKKINSSPAEQNFFC